MATAEEDKCRRRSDSFGILPPNLFLVLLGNNWKQNISVGNLILEKTEFIQLLKCEKGSGTLRDTQLTVVNTPDVLRSTLTERGLNNIIQDITTLSAPGPHVFLLVLQPEDFTEQQKTRLQSVLESFSEQAFNHSLVLISTPRAAMPWFMEKCTNNPHIRDMIIKCRYRYLWMNNTESDLELEQFKRKELFTRISQMLKDNEEKMSKDPLDSGTRNMEKSDGSRLDCVRITLIGKTGNGKSSSGNTILGRKEFKTKPSQFPVTEMCEKKLSIVDGRAVAVVDTPGIFDTTKESIDDTDVERLKCISLLAPGPHIFLLVFQPFLRFTEEESKSLELIKNGFGKGVEKFTIILLAHGDQLEYSKMSIDEFINENCSDCFKQLLSECGNRYHVFNNCNIENRTQVKELLKKIDALVEENEGGCYTNDMLLNAEAAVKKEMERKYKQEINHLKQVIEKEREQNTFLVRKLETDLVEMGAELERWKERFLEKLKYEMKSRKWPEEFDQHKELLQENIECSNLQQKKQKEGKKQSRETVDTDEQIKSPI